MIVLNLSALCYCHNGVGCRMENRGGFEYAYEGQDKERFQTRVILIRTMPNSRA